MNTARIELFAIAKELAGASEVAIEIPNDVVVDAAMVLKLIAQQHPALQPITVSCRLAVNCRYAGGREPIPDGADLALIPPVSGG